MLNINPEVFVANLSLTRAYCTQQIKKGIKDNAIIFRSFNPVHNGKSLFSFETSKFSEDYNIAECTTTKWSIDPLDLDYTIDDIFQSQIQHKRACNLLDEPDLPLGRILISHIDLTLVDGASEAQSLGLIDGYDIPPVDTWFYFTKSSEGRLLFAWIPDKFVYHANEGVEVNCIDMLQWFDTTYPDEYKRLLKSDSSLPVLEL